MTSSSIEDEEIVLVEPMHYNRYGWVRDCKDDRDYKFNPDKNLELPRMFSLRKQMPPVFNQGKLGSCTANSICNAIKYCEMKKKVDDNKIRSRLFLYYNERAIEGNVNEDSGAQIRNGIKSVNSQGVCFEESWPYVIHEFTEKPPKSAYLEAKNHLSIKYHRVNQKIDDIKLALKSGYPVVFGFVVFDSIEKSTVTRSGIIPLPGKEDKEIGGHCVLCCGWDDNTRMFEIQNSWGTEWSPREKGYGWMSYDYLSNPDLASDFWVITFMK